MVLIRERKCQLPYHTVSNSMTPHTHSPNLLKLHTTKYEKEEVSAKNN